MTYIVAIYATDYLMLLELNEALEREFPFFQLKVFGNQEFMDSLPAEALDYVSTNVSEMKQADVIILLDKLPDYDSFIKSYYGKVIKLTERINAESKSEDLHYVCDPLFKILDNLAQANQTSHINLSLPMAVYGKQGIDVLMQETRSVYSFEDYDESMLPVRIAFNVQFYEEELPGGLFTEEIKELRRKAELSVRLNPVSTVFIADIYFQNEPVFTDTGFTYRDISENFSLEDVSAGSIIFRRNRGNLCTLAGDYLHLKTYSVVEALRTVIKELEE